MSRKRKVAPGTWIERELYESRAYLNLRGFAPQLLTLFLGKRQFRKVGRPGKERRTCVNCDNLTMTYIELKERYKITIPRALRAIDDLLAKGFIEYQHQGGAYKRDKSVFSLSDRWCLWTPGMVISKRQQDVRRGFQGQRKEPRPKAVKVKSRVRREKQAFLDRAKRYEKAVEGQE